MKFTESYRKLRSRLLEGPGVTARELRQRVCAYAESLAEKPEADNPFEGPLAKWVEKVARYAYKTLPGEVEAMKQNGQSEDEIFELTIAAAIGAASGRYERALLSIKKGYAE
ncbi:MAG: hypothetical protein E2P02_27375 [Acidobacteria bacterium]|nr:MAG: hypothetical protein E2P02_27375 [Acidobacteriota bacterium]